MLKKCFLISLLLCLWVLGATAADVRPGSERVLVDSCGFFPQLSADGQWLLYSPTEATSLMLKNLTTGAVTTVSDTGYPGFDAVFGDDGKVYYVTQQRKKNGMVYRAGHCYDPATGKDQVVLKPQHGRVQALHATGGTVINGERQVYRSNGHVGSYVYTRGDMLYLVDEGGTTRTLQPVKETNGYLWASLSPDGTKVMFEAAKRGLFVCDLNGAIIADLGMFLMPCWYNDDYIIAMSNAGNIRLEGSRIWLISVDGETIKPISPKEERAVQPMVADGKVVYSVIYSGKVKQMELDIAPALALAKGTGKGKTQKVKEAAGKKDAPRVFINPGHGGHDSDDRHVPTWVIGAQDTLHYYESNSNLTKGLALQEILRNKGYETQLSRVTNTTEDDMDLFEIVSLAANSGADIFLSIHSNATGIEKRINFPLGLYRGWDGQDVVEGSLRLSRLVTKQLVGSQLAVWTSKEHNNGDWSFYDWGYKVGLGVLRFNKLPGFLSEGSFHDYLPERERLLNDSYCWLEAWNQSLGIDEYFGRKGKFKNGVLAGTVRWTDKKRQDDDQRLFDEDQYRPVNGALLRLYNGRGVQVRVFTLDNLDNGVFVFTNLPKDKYRLELFYGNEDLYDRVNVKVNKNATSYKNLKLSKDQKPKKN
ncbi:MAG: N-acetylmuramoyl-L-alanine amidase [Muribaculaceae bacterium]|nr:N-acetylmuramoyl-L-alanine amidase [Muribaculaceae bacterium]